MKIAFVFSGQGSQSSGMGKELYDNFDVCKRTFEEASDALGFSIKDICFGQDDSLNKTSFAQPAILTHSISGLRLLQKEGIRPDYVAGLSLGEYSAFTAAGAFLFEDAVRLVQKRGKFMEEATPKGFGSMSAIMNLDRELVKKACEESSKDENNFVSVANFNAPGQIVISGSMEALETAEEKCMLFGAKRVMRVNVAAPFHTKFLEPAAVKLEFELLKTNIDEIKIPVITNLSADIISDKNKIIQNLRKQIISSVLWEQSVEKMIELGVDTFIEIGPGKTLSSFIKKINKDVNILNVENLISYKKTLEFFQNKV